MKSADLAWAKILKDENPTTIFMNLQLFSCFFHPAIEISIEISSPHFSQGLKRWWEFHDFGYSHRRAGRRRPFCLIRRTLESMNRQNPRKKSSFRHPRRRGSPNDLFPPPTTWAINTVAESDTADEAFQMPAQKSSDRDSRSPAKAKSDAPSPERVFRS